MAGLLLVIGYLAWPGTAFAQAGPTATPDAQGVIYAQVLPGDSLWSVAARAGLSLDELLTLNNLERDDFIYEGQLLIVGYVTPAGAAESGAEATPTPTLSPTPLPSPTATAAPVKTGGDLCLLAYDDANRNGLPEPDEALRPAVAFTISDGQMVVSNYVTDGQSEPYCIRGLPAGNYQVTRSSLPQEALTTPGDWAVALADGAMLNLAFGSVMEAAEATASSPNSDLTTPSAAVATPPSAAGDSGSRMMSGVAVSAVILAVLLLLGVLIFILSARRST
ncbi:MAG: LysM domain-containing protein [Chloroflexota bacterium]